ncbi:MAG: hypothetical protein ABI890_02995 [Lapillicoccus sp.]
MSGTIRALRRYARCLTAGSALAALALGGCSAGADEPEPAGGPGLTSWTGTLPVPALAHLSDTRCQADARGTWSFRATVTNRDHVTLTYTVTASLVRHKDGTVVGARAMTTTLAAGESAHLAADSFFTGDPEGLVCVPTVVDAPE